MLVSADRCFCQTSFFTEKREKLSEEFPVGQFLSFLLEAAQIFGGADIVRNARQASDQARRFDAPDGVDRGVRIGVRAWLRICGVSAGGHG
jgi:hypothetical protein